MTEQEVMRFNDQDLEKRLQRAKSEQELLQKELRRREKFKRERKLVSLKDQLNNLIKKDYLRLVFTNSCGDIYNSMIDIDIDFDIKIEDGYLVIVAEELDADYDY